MSDSNQETSCVGCGQVLPAGQHDCGACGICGEWQALIRAVRFASDQFAQWAKNGMIDAGPAEAIAKDMDRRQQTFLRDAKQGCPLPADMASFLAGKCWHCQAPLMLVQEQCATCGARPDGPMAWKLRHLILTCFIIRAQCDSGRLPLAQAHACMNDAKAWVATMYSHLEQDYTNTAAPAADTASKHPAAGDAATRMPPSQKTTRAESKADVKAAPRQSRSLWEALLDPRTIQWLLGLGGAMLVLGLVIWLATLGFFQNPMVVAVVLGIGNALFLIGGWAIIRLSRYQTAGRAITLLACVVMPLNLWFYHAYGLVTLEGHLWVPALVCCVLYLASALVLRDALFVYVFNGGIAMTGLLMLVSNGRFWEIAAPSVLLVVLGLLSIHLERAFPEIESPFSRRRFGRAFFQSGHLLLAAGLLLVLGAQIAGDWLYRPLFEPIHQQWQSGPPAIVTEHWGQLLALALVLAGTYAYFYSDIVVRRKGIHAYLAVFTLFWAEVLAIELLTLTVTAEVVIIAMASTALAVNLLQPRLLLRKAPGPADASDNAGKLDNTTLSFMRAAQPMGLALSTVPVLLGMALHLRAIYRPLNDLWRLPNGELYSVTWTYVIAMLVTAISCRIGAHIYRHSNRWLSATYFFGMAAVTLTGLVGLLSVLGLKSWDEVSPLVMIVPIVYIIAARLYRGHTQEEPLVLVSHASTAVMIAAVLAAAMHMTPEHVVEPTVGKPLNLLLAAFFAEAAVFYALAAAFRKHGFSVYLAAATVCGALWQLLQYWEVGAEYYTLLFAFLGLLLLIGYRLAVLEWTGLVTAAFQCANALMSVSFVAAALITLSRLATHPGEIHWSTVFLLLVLTVLSLLAAWLVQHAAFRRWYIVTAIAEAGLLFITLHVLSHLSLWDKLEIFSVIAGTALLIVGHIGWHREHDQHSDLVSFSLLAGSVLVAAPLAIAVLIHRCRPTPEFSTLNELGMFVAGLLLLTTGLAFQLRATTIIGGGLLVTYLVTLVLYINMLENVQTAAIWMIIGGALVVGTGIVLSICRDRLLTLPERIRRHEGAFRVLSWR